MPHLLAALGERLPEDAQPILRPLTEPLEELLLELTDPRIVEKDGTRRAQASAKLTYYPSTKGKREVTSEGRFVFTSPLGPIESEELSWYLERYYSWPTGVFKQRAQKVEQQLPMWGKAIYEAVLNNERVREVLIAWNSAASKAARRFTVYVDPNWQKGQNRTNKQLPMKPRPCYSVYPGASARWTRLPVSWRQTRFSPSPVAQRRFLEGTVAEPPIRIRWSVPDLRTNAQAISITVFSALPLVSALETLGEMTELTMLSPPTFPALSAELQRARQEKYALSRGAFRRSWRLS